MRNDDDLATRCGVWGCGIATMIALGLLLTLLIWVLAYLGDNPVNPWGRQ